MNSDLIWFKNCLKNTQLIDKLKKIQIIITDVDGCLTDGQVFYTGNDDKIKGFSVQDGFAISKAQKAGLPIAMLTGRKDKGVALRAKALGIPDDLYFEGFCDGKTNIVKKIQQKKNTTKEQTLFFGDDFLDVECIDEVGFFVTPQNAVFYIANKADLIIPKNGSSGAFRLLLDLILYVQEKHFAQDLITQTIK